MKFDDLLKKIGEFGPYQKRVYFLLCLPAIPIGLQSMIQMVFLLAIPNHRCSIPGMANDTYAVQSKYHERLIEASIPRTEKDGELTYSECSVYLSFAASTNGDFHLQNATSLPKDVTHSQLAYNSVTEKSDMSLTFVKNSTVPCDSWVFDRSVYGTTLATDLLMVCERRFLAPHAKMVVMAGMFAGSLLSGPLSDIMGRKTVIVGGLFGCMVGSVCLTWVPSFTVFAVLLFAIHSSSMAAYMACFVFGTELVAPTKRKYTGIIMNMFWCFGNLLVAGVVFFIRDWKYRQLGFALPGILFLLYPFVIPESPRWLLMRKKNKEASKIICKMAKVNKSQLRQEDIDLVIARDRHDVQPFWRLFQSRVLFLRCLILFFNWFAAGMGFYGLSINIVNMAGNVYVNYVIFNVFEFSSYIVCLLVVERIGRKGLHCSAMLVGGIACTLTIIPRLVVPGQYYWINTVLATIGNTGVCAGFATIYLFSLELLPTVSRNSGLGLSSVFARIGSLASPYVADLGWIIGGRFGNILPLLIFGLTMIAAGLLSLILPETLNQKLPETVEDAEMLGRAELEPGRQDLTPLNAVADLPSSSKLV